MSCLDDGVESAYQHFFYAIFHQIWVNLLHFAIRLVSEPVNKEPSRRCKWSWVGKVDLVLRKKEESRLAPIHSLDFLSWLLFNFFKLLPPVFSFRSFAHKLTRDIARIILLFSEKNCIELWFLSIAALIFYIMARDQCFGARRGTPELIFFFKKITFNPHFL